MLRIGSKGFTLMEVMVATAVLLLGIVFIYEAFFKSLSCISYCSNYLNVMTWADEKIWDAQNRLNQLGPQALVAGQGIFTRRNKDFSWDLSYGAIDENLYKIELALYWQEDRRDVRLTRGAYAIYEQRE